MSSFRVSLLDYGAGNVRSLRNAIKSLGYEIDDITTAQQISEANMIIFPGVGSYGQAMKSLREKGWTEALIRYISDGRPFFGICIGMQSLFQGSEESPDVPGLGIIPGIVTRFDTSDGKRVPQIGWNGVYQVKPCVLLESISVTDTVYFVHSFCAMPTVENIGWVLGVTDYGSQKYISMIQKGNVIACQFHPEKSGAVGLNLLRSFLERGGMVGTVGAELSSISNLAHFSSLPSTHFVKRIIACLDVRSNDVGDLIVTKGDQYDVREEADSGRGAVRNLGLPVALCERYYREGADEIVFLNITSFRKGVIQDLPMLQVLEKSSENVFVPLTVGGGIREYTDESGTVHSALDVAGQYFRAGADKVSIGGDAVTAAEEYLISRAKTGGSCIEQISQHYGAQAVVVSIDPKRVYVSDPTDARILGKHVVELQDGDNAGFGPAGERFVWWQTTVKGGRETRDIDAIELAKVSEILGAGEIMLNCIDMDGQGNGYDIALVRAVRDAVTIPVIASSGAGAVEHFSEIFRATDVPAALAAGIFHRNEVAIQSVKDHLKLEGIPFRA